MVSIGRLNAIITTAVLDESSRSAHIPVTRNEAWGFWSSMNVQASAAWPLAMAAISDATCQPLESVRAFLDSCHGRHFADDVLIGLHAGQNLQAAINAATHRWMGWTIGRLTRHRHGIPRGLPLPDWLCDSLRDH